MRWASATSTRADTAQAAKEALLRVASAMRGQAPSVAFLFVSAEHGPTVQQAIRVVRARFPDTPLVGCTGGGVIGNAREYERELALSITVAHLPDAEAVPFAISPRTIAARRIEPFEWRGALGLEPEHQPSFVVLGDPSSCDVDGLLGSLDMAFPGAPKVGGLASGAQERGEERLFLGDEIVESGAVGVALYGDVQMHPVVGQGCRPIGKPMRVTGAERNLLRGLDGEPALAVLDRLYHSLPKMDQQLFRRSPHLGIGLDPDEPAPKHGGFLVRNLAGVDRAQGVLAVGAALEEGQVVQFHVRDAGASAHELELLLGHDQAKHPTHPVAGGLLFNCLGRGSYFYGEPDHDSHLFHKHTGSRALGGFFCNGELGPVQGKTYLHGYTASFALFRPRGWT